MIEKCCEECPGDDTCEHAKCCMCGAYMDGHSDMWEGHSAVSMHHYYSRPPRQYLTEDEQ